MGVTPSNTMLGPIELFTGLFGATEPANAAAAVGVGWTDRGGTLGGANLNLNPTYTPLVVDQVDMEVGAEKTGQEVSIATQLAEPTLENLRMALNDLSTPEVGEEDELEFGGTLLYNESSEYQAVMLRGRKPGGGPRMWIVRRVLVTEGIGIPFQKDGQTVIPVTFRGYFVSTSVRAVRVSDKAA